MSSKLLLVKADICFSAARALSFFDVDLDLIFSPKDECLGVTPPPTPPPPSEAIGVTLGVDGMAPEAG